MEKVGWWCNNQWGRSRRQIWLLTDGTCWRVEARQGAGDKTWGRDCSTEKAARHLVDEMLARSEGWKDFTDLLGRRR